MPELPAAEGHEDLWDEVENLTPVVGAMAEPEALETVASRRRSRNVSPNSPIVMVETAFLASAASLVWVVNSYFPLGPLLTLFFAIPIALIYLRWGKRASWMGALTAALLLTILMGPLRAVQYMLMYGFLGILLGSLWRRRASWGTAIALGTLLMTIGTFIWIVVLSGLVGEDLWRYSTTQVTGLLDWIFDRLNLLDRPSLDLVAAMALGFIVLKNVFYLFIVHVAAWFLCDRLGNPISRAPRWVSTIFEME
jgi:uncharacterized protein YybS (DUF2232 family)